MPVRLLDLPPQPPAIGGARDHETGASVRARALTGLALVAMGGLLMLASGGHPWARDLVRAAWPLFILAVGFCTVMVVTDRDDVVGKISVVVGVAILFVARFGIMPEETLRALGPWALILAGLAIALSGVGLRARPVHQDKVRSTADLTWDQVLEYWARRGRAPLDGLSVRRGGIDDAEVAASRARRLRPRGAECSLCRAIGDRRE